MLVKMAEVLVKIVVMMMAPSSVPVPPEVRGREPPSFFFFLDLLPRWEKGFPSGPWSPWRGRGESPSEIGYVSLCFCALLCALSPFCIYMEIRNSDWIETFTQIFLRKLAFLRTKKSSNRLAGAHEGQRRAQGVGHAPCLVPPSGTVSRGFFFPYFPNIPKIFSVHFYPVWIPFDMGFL